MSSHVAIVLALATAACADLETGARTQAIIGGETATPAEFPTVVALEDSPGNWGCTGTLVDESWILTAAHCVVGETVARLDIRFDDPNVNNGAGGLVVAVAAIHKHPDFDEDVWDNDIAVIELAEPMTTRAPTPIHRAAIPAGTMLTQVGYGDSNDSGGGAGILRKLVSQNIACDSTGDPKLSDANLVCFDSSDGAATCYGDSGGPTFLAVGAGLEVVGVNSGGTEDLCLQGYDLQTSVAGELDFVDQFVPVVEDPPPGDDDPPPGDDAPPGDDDGDAPGSGGCAAGSGGDGGGGSALVLGLALALALRRRRVGL